MLLFPFKNKVSIYFNIKNTLVFLSFFFIWLISSDMWPLNQCIVNTSSVYIHWTCYVSSCNIYCFASYLRRTTFSHESRTEHSILFIQPLKYSAYLDYNWCSSYLIYLYLSFFWWGGCTVQNSPWMQKVSWAWLYVAVAKFRLSFSWLLAFLLNKQTKNTKRPKQTNLSRTS